jgi:hypothetical protein
VAVREEGTKERPGLIAETEAIADSGVPPYPPLVALVYLYICILDRIPPSFAPLRHDCNR